MYEDFYGFSERPFQLTPDPSFFFESVTHKKALTYLNYGIAQGEGFIVITGEVGAGKSTLVGHLRNRLDWNSVRVGEIVTSALGDNEMITMAAHSFGLEVEAGDKAGALAQIEHFLQDEARAGRKVLLIVDEAQNLTVGALEELRMLSNFHLGAQPLLQMLLLGQPEFRQLLNEWDELEQLRQRIIASHHLDAMEADEVRPYVMHRLDHVGYSTRPQFEDGVWRLVQDESRGIPRLVNRILSRVLMRGAMESRDTIDEALVETVIDEMNGRKSETPPMIDTNSDAYESRPSSPQAVATGDREIEDSPAQPSRAGEPALLDAQIEAIEQAFADRDRIVASLRKEVSELKEAGYRPAQEGDGDIAERLTSIESRMEDQERTLRQVLAMMIDYFENSASQDAA